MNLNKNTCLTNDNEEQTIKDKCNNIMFRYNTNLDCQLKNNYNMASGHVGLFQTNNSGRLNNIDAESKLFNGKMGNVMTSNNTKHLKSLPTRVFAGSPYKKTNLYNLDTNTDSKLKKGKLISFRKSTSKLSDMKNDRFIPLINSIKNEIQNPVHIIPTWTRGGESTRTNLRSVKHN